MTPEAFDRATDALRDLRRRLFFLIEDLHPSDRAVEVELEVIRHLVAAIDWGLGSGPRPSPWAVWIGRLRPTVFIARIDEALDRINAVAARVWQGERDVPLAWLSAELEQLEATVTTVSRRLSDIRRFSAAAGLQRELVLLRGELLTFVLTRLDADPR